MTTARKAVHGCKQLHIMCCCCLPDHCGTALCSLGIVAHVIRVCEAVRG